MKPEISIIIPAFNRAHCLPRALASIRAQQLASCEILLGDDASTDDTVAVARREWPDIRVFSLTQNSGAAAARNAALIHVQGKWIAFLDSDDEWLPGKIAAQLAYLQEHPEVGICGCGHELILPTGETREFPGRNPSNWRDSLARAQSFHGASTPLMRFEILQRLGGQDESLRVLEDWDWMLRAAALTKLHVLPDMLVRIYENNPSKAEFTRQATVRFLEKHAQEFARQGWKAHSEIASQHGENAARNAFLHREYGVGLALLLRSFLRAPWRNPLCLAAVPVALWDLLTRRRDLPRVLQGRARRATAGG